MYKKATAILPLLAGSVFLLTGFNWNFGGDKCKGTVELVNKMVVSEDVTEQTRDEEKILSDCPDSAAANFVKGLQSERAGDIDGAISFYLRSLQKEPDFAAASGNLGLLYMQKGMHDEAAVALTKGLAGVQATAYHKAMGRLMADKKFYPLAQYHYGQALLAQPADADLLAGQAEIYTAQGQTDRAIDEYRRTLLLEPGHEQSAAGLAAIYQERNRSADALGVLKKASASNPGSGRLHLLLADQYAQRGDTRQAEYERILGGQRANAGAVAVQSGVVTAAISASDGLRQADRLVSQGELEKAAEAYREQIRQQPDSVLAQERLGNLYFHAGRDDDAVTAYREASYLGSVNPEVYYNLGQLYERRGHLDEAVVAYKRTIERQNNHADARLRLAEIRMERGNAQEALEQYTEYLRLNPANTSVQLKLAQIHQQNKRPDLAEQVYKSALATAPSNLDANRELAILYRDQGRNKQAIEHFRRVLDLQKDDADSRNALIAIYVKEKKYDKIEKLLQEAIEISPDDPVNYYKMGLMQDFNKQHDQAIDNYKKAIELKPDNARAMNALGRVYMKTGRLAEAREVLQAAKEVDPSMEEASFLLNNIKDDFQPVPRAISNTPRPRKAAPAARANRHTTVRPAAKPKGKTKQQAPAAKPKAAPGKKKVR